MLLQLVDTLLILSVVVYSKIPELAVLEVVANYLHR